MKKTLTRPILQLSVVAASVAGLMVWSGQKAPLEASSHREAPLIADDPVADNTDVYAFRSPDDPTKVTIIANYIPFQLPQGGPNYYHFGENVRYEIHIKNKTTTEGDDITYRFTFTRTNEDPTTHFNIRLGKENLKTTYRAEMSMAGGPFTTIVANGVVPAYNVGPRAISSPVGLNVADYNTLIQNSIQTLGNGTKVFCGPVDDPFFVDIGGIEDLGGVRRNSARDGLFHKNVNTIALQIPINLLQKDGKPVSQAANILDSDYIIGVWASASRPSMRTLGNFGIPTTSGEYVQVSRLGMPLTNEVVNPVGSKDEWNGRTPYNENRAFDNYFNNPELALYMDDSKFGSAVPGIGDLRIQTRSLGQFDFRNGANGLAGLLGNPATAGTALAPQAQGGFGEYLLRTGQPRSVDLLPIFHTGVPNLRPYQLATGKGGNPLAAGKPFINNFLPVVNANGIGGDMLRLNMAVPVTPRNSPDFSPLGLVYAAVVGNTDPRYNGSTALQAIPNMDGFPNGRRLEDDVVRIELQAVSGLVLAAIGLPYDDNPTGMPSPYSQKMQEVISFTTGVGRNDTTLKMMFPFQQTPWAGTNPQLGGPRYSDGVAQANRGAASALGLQPAKVATAENYPNPFTDQTTFRYDVTVNAPISITVSDMMGRKVATIVKSKVHAPGSYEVNWRTGNLKKGDYIATISTGSTVLQTVRLVHDTK
ncbi:DUF4331 family protein [Hymenobacter norwichensis]|uniref:DUF4331 family protein n=1 Tax=Hymenobacter norwichensis TaxID=223903 RepID=UPI0003B6483C|nr:DUF4331 family protein [Hymenobacter norwichensis]